MGRDVAGLRVDSKRPNMINGVALDRVHVAPKIAQDKAEIREHEVEDQNPRRTSNDEAQEKQDVLGVKGTNTKTSVPEEKIRGEALKPSEKKLTSPVKPVATSQSPELSNEKHASHVVNTSGVGNIDAAVFPSSKTDDFSSPVTAEKPQPNSPSISRKPMHHDGNTDHDDEEDNNSLASSNTPSSMHSAATSVRTAKFKVTVPVAPTFRSAERLQRRKEFYMKLEEKQKALEAEKQEYAARTKEEEEAAIEQLRKSMVYKANPVPSFYREGPPPKTQLKKLPVTRAKSPNLTRRKSCSNTVKSSPDEKKACDQPTRHSIGIYKDAGASPRTPKNKDIPSTRNANGPSKLKESNGTCKANTLPRQVKETERTSQSDPEQISTDIPIVAETKHSYTTTEEETRRVSK